jgi:uncharacterized protein YhhL (DUF1145 family)
MDHIPPHNRIGLHIYLIIFGMVQNVCRLCLLLYKSQQLGNPLKSIIADTSVLLFGALSLVSWSAYGFNIIFLSVASGKMYQLSHLLLTANKKREAKTKILMYWICAC